MGENNAGAGEEKARRSEMKNSLRSFLIELLVYAVLVFAYFLLVLKYLGHWLFHLFHDERKTYAWVALGLIVVQGVVLEALTRLLLGIIKPRMEEE
jgi:cytochrome c biogenesis protein CcdA